MEGTYRATVKHHNGGDIVEVWDGKRRLAGREIPAAGIHPQVWDQALLLLGYERVSGWASAATGFTATCRPLEPTSSVWDQKDSGP